MWTKASYKYYYLIDFINKYSIKCSRINFIKYSKVIKELINSKDKKWGFNLREEYYFIYNLPFIINLNFDYNPIKVSKSFINLAVKCIFDNLILKIYPIQLKINSPHFIIHSFLIFLFLLEIAKMMSHFLHLTFFWSFSKIHIHLPLL